MRTSSPVLVAALVASVCLYEGSCSLRARPAGGDPAAGQRPNDNPGPTRGGQLVSGVVYEDRNGNGARDATEPGVVGVLVSNGLDVVPTGAAGRYRLSVADGDAVFVIKPAGYSLPVDENMLPRYYYLHRPRGTPPQMGLRHPGIEPSGPLPAAIDFPLTRVEEPDHFRVVLIADPQPRSDVEVNYVRDDFAAQIAGIDAAFGITHGDIVFDDLGLLPRYNAILARVGIPWYNVPGNHDVNFLSPDDGSSLETFKRIFGPPYYAHAWGRAVFISLDTVFYQGTDHSHKEGIGDYRGQLSEVQLRWMKNLLAHVPDDRLIVVSMHIPLDSAIATGPRGRVGNRRELLRLLCNRPHVVAFGGHTHAAEHRVFGPADGCPKGLRQQVLATVSGAWWSGPFDERGIPTSLQLDGTPNGYYLLHVRGTAYSTEFVPLNHPADHQLRIVLESETSGPARKPPTTFPRPVDFRPGEPKAGRFAASELSHTRLVVNLFAGGPRSSVVFRLDGQAPRRCTRTLRSDPFVEELYRVETNKKPYARPVRSPHIWQARLPSDLKPGVHTIQVRARDEFGREHIGTKIFEVGP